MAVDYLASLRNTNVFSVNPVESRICDNYDFFTLNKKLLSVQEIKHGEYQHNVRLFSFTGICTLFS